MKGASAVAIALLVGAACGGRAIDAPAVHTTALVRAAAATLHSEKASRCPPRLPASPPLVGAARVDMVLVPIAAIRVDACLYRDTRIMTSATFVDGRIADRIENAVNTLQGEDPGSGATCAPGAVGAYLVLFGDGVHTTSVRGATSGCEDPTNGFLTATVTPQWRVVLHRLLRDADGCASRYGRSAGCVVSGSW